MNRMHVADRAVPDPLAKHADRVGRMPLVAQLRDHLVLGGGLHQRADFADRVRQRLLAVDVLAALDGRHRHHGVRVIGGGHDYRIDGLLHPVEHFAEVLELPGGGVFLAETGGRRRIDVAQGHDVAVLRQGIAVFAARPAQPDHGNIQPVAGRSLPAAGHCTTGHDTCRGRCGGAGLQETATCDKRFVHGDFLVNSVREKSRAISSSHIAWQSRRPKTPGRRSSPRRSRP